MSVIKMAADFAILRHGEISHKRKYTGEPYHHHLRSVAALVAAHGGSDEMIAAAWLHDVVEDTDVCISEVSERFGRVVARLVIELTDISSLSDGNREERKRIDRLRIAGASRDAKTIKLADLCDNAVDIIKNDKSFSKVFIKEMALLLDVLSDGNSELHKRCSDIVRAHHGGSHE